MSKNTWVILAITVIVLITIALLAMIIFLPNAESELENSSYDGIDKLSYAYEATKEYTDRQQEYEITPNDIVLGRSKSIYIPGNPNPFTVKSDLDIYGNPISSGYVSTLPGSTGSRNRNR